MVKPHFGHTITELQDVPVIKEGDELFGRTITVT